MSIGQRIAQLLELHGMKPAELARRLGLAPSTISKWTSEAWPPNYDNLVKVAAVFGMTMAELFEGVVAEQVAG